MLLVILITKNKGKHADSRATGVWTEVRAVQLGQAAADFRLNSLRMGSDDIKLVKPLSHCFLHVLMKLPAGEWLASAL